MTDNRTTELLCKLLDKHGIAWKKRRGYIRWSKQTEYGVTHYQAWPCFDGTITLTVRDEYELTPEQAIAATLGSECHVETCEPDEPDGWYKCPDCGCVVGYWLLNDDSWTIYMDDYQIPFNACPNCGRRVER